MRLLNATTLEVESFAPGANPKYAILSHRWTNDEVTLQDIEQGTARAKAGFAKLEASCSIARAEGLSHVWADTCCIDKSSSAELSEAINSMFRYYQDAEICYAYLLDATGASDFLESDWFNRGWTLQELIAPREVHFYDGQWIAIGDRTGLSERIGSITGIAQAYLHGCDLSLASIAERMSWAAKRKTMRPEDIAYCLLGIFDIHMPLLYGEGAEKAFVRLQRKILKEATDESWLAWGPLPGAPMDATPDKLYGMLARSPAYFWRCGDLVVCHTSAKTPISTSNLGIHVDIPEVSRLDERILLLGCRTRHNYQNVVGIPVSRRMGRYYRASMIVYAAPETKWTKGTRGIVKILSMGPYREPENPMDSLYVIEGIDPRFRLAEVFPPAAWEPSPTHIRARRIGDEPCLPRRFLRLEHVGDAGAGEDRVDYVLRLDGIMAGETWKPSYELGILPKDVRLADAEHLGIHFGQAVRIPRERGALSAKMEIKSTFMTDTCVVTVFMDMAGIEDGSGDRPDDDVPKAQSLVLAIRPGEVERLRQQQRQEQEKQEATRAAEEERARLDKEERIRVVQEKEALAAQKADANRTYLGTGVIFGIIAVSSFVYFVLFIRAGWGSAVPFTLWVACMSSMYSVAGFYLRVGGEPKETSVEELRRKLYK